MNQNLIFIEIQRKRNWLKLHLWSGVPLIGLLAAWVWALLTVPKESMPNILLAIFFILLIPLALFQWIVSHCPSCKKWTPINEYFCHECGAEFVKIDSNKHHLKKLSKQQVENLQLMFRKRFRLIQLLSTVSMFFIFGGLGSVYIFTLKFSPILSILGTIIGYLGVGLWAFVNLYLYRCPNCNSLVSKMSETSRKMLVINPLLSTGSKPFMFCANCGLSLSKK